MDPRKVGSWSQSQYRANLERVTRIQLTVFRKVVPGRESQGKVTTCGMATGNDSGQIKLVLGSQNAQVIGAASDVQKGVGPSPALVADPAVLDAPDRVSGVRDGLLERTGVSDIVLRQPTSTVEEDDDRMRPRPRWQAEMPELERVLPVCDAMFRRRRG